MSEYVRAHHESEYVHHVQSEWESSPEDYDSEYEKLTKLEINLLVSYEINDQPC